MYHTGSETDSLINQAHQNDEQYIDLLEHDYIVTSHKDGRTQLMQRTKYNYPRKKLGYSKFKDLFYKIDDVPDSKKSDTLPNNLVVLFAHMNWGPGGKYYDSANVIERVGANYFEDLQRSLVKNTYILRLPDFNISHGSHYESTPNFPDYEEQVQGLLKKFRKDLNVSHDRVVLYGGSKAGTGALVHGVLGDYHAVACDPIINATKYNEDSDRHFVKNFRPADLSSKINGAKKGNRREKVIIANRFVEFNFQNSQKVNGGAIRLIDLNDPTIVKHPRVTPESVPEQLALMNIMLDGHKTIGNRRFGLKKLIGK